MVRRKASTSTEIISTPKRHKQTSHLQDQEDKENSGNQNVGRKPAKLKPLTPKFISKTPDTSSTLIDSNVGFHAPTQDHFLILPGKIPGIRSRISKPSVPSPGAESADSCENSEEFDNIPVKKRT